MSRPPTPSDPRARGISPYGPVQQLPPNLNRQPPPRTVAESMSRSPPVTASTPTEPTRLLPSFYDSLPTYQMQSAALQQQSNSPYHHIAPHPPLVSPIPQAYAPPQHLQHSPQMPTYGVPNGNPNANQPFIMPHTAQQTDPVPPSAATKKSRINKACDLCATRKVKCSSLGPGSPPCKGCQDLRQPCTFNRDSKRRGPANKHRQDEEQNKRQRVDGFFDPSQNQQSNSPENIRETVGGTLASMATVGGANGHYPHPYNHALAQPIPNFFLCDKSLIDRLIDDFFRYIHPLAPFPHEPSFREAYRDQHFVHNPKFLALLYSMVAALVSSFPRKPREHMRELNLEDKFHSSLDFIKQCHFAAVDARGARHLDEDLTIYDGCTSYFLGLAAAYTFDWKRTRLYLSETLVIIRALGAHRADVQQPHPSMQIDHIQQQLGRRLFWTMLVGVSSIHQIGAAYGELFIPPPNSSNPYPSLPDEVDDIYIESARIIQQPVGFVSKLVGFNINCRIYSSLDPLSTMEIAYGIDQIYDWNKQKKVLNDCYERVEKVLRAIPPQLLLKPSPTVGEFARYSPVANYVHGLHDGQPQNFSQFEIQKANIYASQLCTRSFLVEKFFNLQDAYARRGGISPLGDGETGDSTTLPNSDVPLEQRVAEERESIVREFLHVLGNISPENMEPNGLSFVNKVRQVASTLIDSKEQRNGPLAIRAKEAFKKLVDLLIKLERNEPATGVQTELSEKEEDLRIWADLRDVQLKFLHAGGFMADS